LLHCVDLTFGIKVAVAVAHLLLKAMAAYGYQQNALRIE
jgi:hypothetical protein